MSPAQEVHIYSQKVLVIRDEQMSALGRSRAVAFQDRLSTEIARAYPDDYATLGEQGIRKIIQDAFAFGASRNIRTENGLSGLAALFIEYGVGLERAPYRDWGLRILSRADMSDQVRVANVRSRYFGLTQGRRIVRFEPSES